MAPPDIVETLSSGTRDVRRVLEKVRARIDAEPDFRALGDTTQIILGEILNNVVEHAYGFEDGHPIYLTVSFGPSDLACQVVDEGVAMPDGRPPNGGMPEIDPQAPETLPEGGFGWGMIHMMTRGLAYSRKDGRNELVFSIPKSAV